MLWRGHGLDQPGPPLLTTRNATTQVVEICHHCASRGYVQPTVYQGMYNAFQRSSEHEVSERLHRLRGPFK